MLNSIFYLLSLFPLVSFFNCPFFIIVYLIKNFQLKNWYHYTYTLFQFNWNLFSILQKSLYYSEIAERYRDGIEKILWNEKDGIWYDYDMLHKTQRNKFYASNFAPLYTRSYNNKNKMMHAKKALKYIKKMNVVFRG